MRRFLIAIAVLSGCDCAEEERPEFLPTCQGVAVCVRNGSPLAYCAGMEGLPGIEVLAQDDEIAAYEQLMSCIADEALDAHLE